MLDVIAIIFSLFVILKYTLRGFSWFQNYVGLTEQQNTKLLTQKQDVIIQKNIPADKKEVNKLEKSNQIKRANEVKQQKICTKQELKQNQDLAKLPIQKEQDNQQNKIKVKNFDNIELKRLQTVSEKQFDDQKPINQNSQAKQDFHSSQQLIKSSQDQLIQVGSFVEIQKNNNNQNNQLENQSINMEDLKLKNQKLLQENQKLRSQKLLFAQKLDKIINQANDKSKGIDKVDINKIVSELKQTYQSKINQMQNSYDNLKSQMQSSLQNMEKTESLENQKSLNQETYLLNEQLKQKTEQLKGQLQFCQNQLQHSMQSQNKLKEEVQQLQKNTNKHGQPSIRQVVNHPEYIRIKEMLNRYQTGSKYEFKPKSFIRGEYTPKVSREDKIDSRISERRQFADSKHISGIIQTQQTDNSAGLLPECDFLTQEDKSFVLSQIKKIKKLGVKKTKQIYKLDKLHLSNPHDYIDNIPNIVLLVELTNGKVIAAFTQIAFSKDDNLLSQKGSLKSGSRMSGIGSNKAVIIDVTSKKAFQNMVSENTIIYDENAIVWGRDQLVIKNDEPTILYSQFSSSNSVFGDGTYTLQQLLGSTKKSQRMNKYQIHRVYIS